MTVWDMAVYLFWSLIAMGLLASALLIMAGYIGGQIDEDLEMESRMGVGS